MDLSLTTIKRLALSLMLVAPLTIGTFSSSPAAASAACDAVTLAAIDQVLGQIKTAQLHESGDSCRRRGLLPRDVRSQGL